MWSVGGRGGQSEFELRHADRNSRIGVNFKMKARIYTVLDRLDREISIILGRYRLRR